MVSLKVGKRYETRNGQVVKVVSKRLWGGFRADYPYFCEDKEGVRVVYAKNGAWLLGQETPWDLVKEVT